MKNFEISFNRLAGPFIAVTVTVNGVAHDLGLFDVTESILLLGELEYGAEELKRWRDDILSSIE